MLDTLKEEPVEEEILEKNWTDIKNIIQKCAEEGCGKKSRSKKKPWFDEECSEAVIRRRKAKDIWLNNQQERLKENYKTHARESVKILRRKKREWINKLLEKAEQDRTANNARDFYCSICFFKKGYTPNPYRIKNKSEKIIIQKEQGLQMWREYFKGLLNGEIQERAEETREMYQNVQPLVSNPTLDEVSQAIKDMKNNKAPEGDGITAEVLKVEGQSVAKQVHKLITKIWEAENTPKEWKEAKYYCPYA